MQYKTSLRPRCNKCKRIRRHGKLMIVCENPRHKQTQG